MKTCDQDAGPPLDLTSVCACILADETFRGWTAEVRCHLIQRMGGVDVARLYLETRSSIVQTVAHIDTTQHVAAIDGRVGSRVSAR